MKRCFLLGALLAIAQPVSGQQAPPTMTLQDAIAIARDRNPGYNRALAQVQVADMGVRAGYGAFLPNLQASVSWNGNSRTQVTGTDDFGRTVQLPNPVTFQSSSASQSLSAGVTLFDGLRNLNNLRAARQDVTTADASVRSQGLLVNGDVSRRFYGALRADRLIEVEESLLASAQDRFSANQRLFVVQGATQVDLLGSEVDVAQQEQNLERQRGEARKARLQVLEVLGVLDEVQDFEPVGSFPAVFDPRVLDANALVLAALDANPLVGQRDAAFAAAELRASSARGGRLPTVTLGGGFSRGLNEQNYGAFWDVNPQDRNFNFGITVSWQVFNRFQTSQQIAQADAARRQADEDFRATKLQVEQEVRAAFIDLENAFEGLQTQQRATALSRRRVELAREQYRLAAITFTNLQTIIEQAANAERALVDAEYNFAVALVTLEERVGAPVSPRG